MLYLAVSNCIINNSERFYVCIFKNRKNDSKWYWKKNSQGPQYCFKIFMYSRSWRVFFKVIKIRPPIDFLFTKAHCSHIMSFKNYILLHIVRKCSCNNFLVHCKTIISSLKYSSSHLLCGMSMVIFLSWAKPWRFSILFSFFWKWKNERRS